MKRTAETVGDQCAFASEYGSGISYREYLIAQLYPSMVIRSDNTESAITWTVVAVDSLLKRLADEEQT